ncbi:MAG: chromate transporter [Clostridia bacterium]|nr:chromate transporter [Clostridia bacterium]
MIFIELFYTFFLIGAFTFGGGYAMLPLIQAEVERKGWLPTEDIVNFIAVSESTPGPFAINIATYIGNQMGMQTYGNVFAALLGAVCSTLGVVMPSFIIILIVAKCYDAFKSSTAVKGAMSGLKPAAIGLIGAAVYKIGMTVFFPNGFTASVFTSLSFYISLVLFAVMAYLTFKIKLHPILIICISAAVGIAAGFLLDLPV